ncbi:hypothetical protein BD770DRAFT_397318 [Pilaira anomala]|nr:hypothetical protein BD770DRAFT_397318 [Pilaira anomala]
MVHIFHLLFSISGYQTNDHVQHVFQIQLQDILITHLHLINYKHDHLLTIPVVRHRHCRINEIHVFPFLTVINESCCFHRSVYFFLRNRLKVS